MHKYSKILFNDKILNEAINRFGFDKDEVEILDGFESFIYNVKQGEKEFILRITHSLHRTENEINAEIDWINYLVKGGVPASRAISSKNGNLVEIISVKDSYFMAIVFEKLSGKHITSDERDEEIYEHLGELIGRSHKLTKDFKFSNNEFSRREWDEELIEFFDFLPKDEKLVLDKIKSVHNEIKHLPKDKDSYGLIHTDAHFGNIFVDDKKLKIFDFDDSSYMWFISDIAIVIFYSVMSKYKDLTEIEFTELIISNFMKGYKKENHISDEWIKRIPLFLKLREMELYLVIHRSFDMKNLNDPWAKWYMEGRKEKIENDIPYLEYDFNEFVKRS